MPLQGFEPAIPVSERPQTHALDSADTGIGSIIKCRHITDIYEIIIIIIIIIITSLRFYTYCGRFITRPYFLY
jgi:hypothetical protein